MYVQYIVHSQFIVRVQYIIYIIQGVPEWVLHM